MEANHYVHGYAHAELQRLHDQARTLIPLLHEGVTFPPGSLVLEAGCGTGAQTVALLENSPDARFVSIDISSESLDGAMERVKQSGLRNRVTFLKADIFDSGFPDARFDHVFVCFVLEHLPQPERALQEFKRLLRPGGTLTLIEGDHGSTFFHPPSEAAWKPISCLIDLQAALGGDSLIGRRLHPLLAQAGFEDVQVRPIPIYADDSLPHMVEGFTWNTYISMVGGIRSLAIDRGLATAAEFDAGMEALQRAGGPGGTFHYTFFRGRATKPLP